MGITLMCSALHQYKMRPFSTSNITFSIQNTTIINKYISICIVLNEKKFEYVRDTNTNILLPIEIFCYCCYYYFDRVNMKRYYFSTEQLKAHYVEILLKNKDAHCSTDNHINILLYLYGIIINVE